MTDDDGSRHEPQAAPQENEGETTESAVAEPTESAVAPTEPSAGSPVLEHLEETMKNAKQAADEALAPQRE